MSLYFKYGSKKKENVSGPREKETDERGRSGETSGTGE